MREHEIQNRIRAALAPFAVVFRANVGRVRTPDGRYFDTGLPAGFSDLFGFRKSDGRMFFIEVKAADGRLSDKQRNFLKMMQSSGAITGVARSPGDAVNIIMEVNENELQHELQHGTGQ